MVSGVNEEEIAHDDPRELVKILAEAKAKAVSAKLLALQGDGSWPDEITLVLGCDSVFELDGEVYGKPLNANHAIERLEKISNSNGLLHTGHFLLSRRYKRSQTNEEAPLAWLSDVVTTEVNFSDITKLEIKKYVETGEPLNCAGCFSLEGRGGVFIRSLNGCYSNVIGLSLPWLRNAMRSLPL